MHELSEFKTSCDIIIEIENNSPWRWYDVIKAAKGLKQTDVMLCKLYQNSYPLKKHTQKNKFSQIALVSTFVGSLLVLMNACM